MHYHFNVHGGISASFDNVGKNAFIAKMMYECGKIGVDIFVIISSWFLAGKELSYANIRNRIKKIYIPVWTYSILIYICMLIKQHDLFNCRNVLKAFFPVVFSNNWYATAYILFLIIVPVLNKGLASLSEKEHRWLAIVLFIYTSVFQTIAGYKYVDASNHFTNLTWFTVCFIITSYFKQYKKQRLSQLRIVGGVAVICFVWFGLSIYLADYYQIFLCLNRPENSVYMMQINYVPVIVCAFALFFIFERLDFSLNFINAVGKATFGIYLIHDNPYICNYIWMRICRSTDCFYGSHFYINALSGIIFIFIICCIIEIIREAVTEKFIKNMKILLKKK